MLKLKQTAKEEEGITIPVTQTNQTAKPRSHMDYGFSDPHLQVGAPKLEERQQKQKNMRREHYMFKRLSIISQSDDEAEDGHSAATKPTTPIFTEVSSIVPSKFKLQLDKLEIQRKPNTDSPASPDSTTAVETVSVPSISTTTTHRPVTPMLVKLFAPSPKHLARLQIILGPQSYLNQLDIYFNSQLRYGKRKCIR